MESLRGKLAFSYGLLIVIIVALSAWGVYNFARLGRIVDVILINNYQSIVAAEDMKEALDREDSAAQFSIAGQVERARQQFAANAEKFPAKYELAASNITEPGEDKIVADIDAEYHVYAAEAGRFINRPPSGSVTERSQYYVEHMEPSFNSLKG